MKKIVAMVALASGIVRSGRRRTDLSYLPYARATWEWWCRRRGIEFVVIEKTRGMEAMPYAPATVQRWMVPGELIERYGLECRVAMVDADTMIRWDTPDFFDFGAGDFCAVRAGDSPWVRASIAAYQGLFPGVILEPANYFNAGMVVVGAAQLTLLDSYCACYVSAAEKIQKLSRIKNVGTDQTCLNFILARVGTPIHWLAREFNSIHCFVWPDRMVYDEYERGGNPDWSSFAQKAFHGRAFDFIERDYVWHFTSTFASRRAVMEETWRRVSSHYPSSGH